jgi:hypothetical protein
MFGCGLLVHGIVRPNPLLGGAGIDSHDMPKSHTSLNPRTHRRQPSHFILPQPRTHHRASVIAAIKGWAAGTAASVRDFVMSG